MPRWAFARYWAFAHIDRRDARLNAEAPNDTGHNFIQRAFVHARTRVEGPRGCVTPIAGATYNTVRRARMRRMSRRAP